MDASGCVDPAHHALQILFKGRMSAPTRTARVTDDDEQGADHENPEAETATL